MVDSNSSDGDASLPALLGKRRRLTDSDNLRLAISLSLNPCLFNKSQTPENKADKKAACTRVVTIMGPDFPHRSQKEFSKALSNIKKRIKEKIDAQRTGNKPIADLKDWEKVILELMNLDGKHHITQPLACGISAGSSKASKSAGPKTGSGSGTFSNKLSEPSHKKPRKEGSYESDEDEELDQLTTGEMQRKVLAAQHKTAIEQHKAAKMLQSVCNSAISFMGGFKRQEQDSPSSSAQAASTSNFSDTDL